MNKENELPEEIRSDNCSRHRKLRHGAYSEDETTVQKAWHIKSKCPLVRKNNHVDRGMVEGLKIAAGPEVAPCVYTTGKHYFIVHSCRYANTAGLNEFLQFFAASCCLQTMALSILHTRICVSTAFLYLEAHPVHQYKMSKLIGLCSHQL